jgi:adenosylmethionine-8-amino-7-oxononanoate aminotransferase
MDNLWMPFTYHKDLADNPPIIIQRGSGIYVYDTDGKKYIDAIGSWWTSIFGHNHPEITAAVKKQLDQIEHVMMAGFITEPTLNLSRLLSEILPKGMSRIFYSDDGSTAVEVALKIALQYHALRNNKRSGFISFDGGYHGDTLGAMSVGSIPMYHALFHERFKKQHFAMSPYCYRCPVQCKPESCSAECMDSLKDLLESMGDQIAACIFEPMVQGAVGMRIYPAKVLKRIFSLCRQFDILTIADEVAMGLGRTGTMFACDHANEIPDIMCLAKGLTGGYMPLSATIVKESIYQEFQGDFTSDRIFNHGHTFTGNPLASSAACAAVGLLKKYDIPHSLQEKSARLQQLLETFRKYHFTGDIRSLGMVGAIELVKDQTTKEKLDPAWRLPYKISQKALEYGCIVRPLGDILYFMPPLTITIPEMETMIYLTEMAMKDTIDECFADLR